MYVIPANGRTVADPYRGDNLPAEGREVEANQYWFRRINDQDVTESTPPVTPAIQKPKERTNENVA